MAEISGKGLDFLERPESKTSTEATVERRGLPDDSGEKIYKCELPEDSGSHAPNDSGRNDIAEVPEKKGGSYKDIKDNMAMRGDTGQEYEVHHIPADSCTKLDYSDGPAIKMEKADHQKTGSCGSSKEAKEYREEQKKLIAEGKFREAFKIDVQDIRDKFGDKYDNAIAEAEAYLDTLESEGKI